MFTIIVATDQSGGIGRNGGIPWSIPSDLAFFAKTTRKTKIPGKTNAVIMGSVTFHSLPERYRPLPGRRNIVLSRNTIDGVECAKSLDEALKMVNSDEIESVFVIGGERVYQEAVCSEYCASILVTRVFDFFACDRFFPDIDPQRFRLVDEKRGKTFGGVVFSFQRYERL